jgi:hypothetical protein
LKHTLALLAISFAPALPAVAAASAVPGALNYVEGQVSVAGQPVTAHSVGSIQLESNQVLQTVQGRAELLLTPGVFLRAGDNSAVRLISPNLGDTRVAVDRGRAIVEVTEIFKENNLSVALDGATARLDKEGLYSFDADARTIRVFDGKATVVVNDREVNLKKGKQLALANSQLKPASFDSKAVASADPLYSWSNLRSEYEAQASMQSARNIFVGGGAYWYGPGWYWNPYWSMYGFIPGDGIWYSPFGWPFYSPWVVYSGGFYRGVYGRGTFLAPGRGHVSGGGFVASGRSLGAAHASGGFAHGFAGGGMHGGFSGGGHR